MGNFLIIRGANFSDTAVDKVSLMPTPSDVQKELNNAELIVDTSSTCNKQGVFELTYRPRIRASIMVKKQYALKNTPWTSNSGRSFDGNLDIDEAHVRTHDMLSLPKSVKKITLNMTAPGYYYGLCVWGDKTGYIDDSGWTEANVPIVKDLSTYPDDFFWITSTIKYGGAGNQYVGEITKEILGWSIKIEQS